MPSLFRYFVVMGGWLLSLLLIINHIYADPPAPPKPVAEKIVIQHDPRASLVERLRNEEEAKRAVARGEPVPTFYAAAPEEPPVAAPSPTLPETPQVVAPVALKTTPADAEADAHRKAEQAKAAKARKARLARERAEKQRREEAARQQQQDFFGFGAPRPAYAEAPRPASPFGWTW